MPTQAERGIRIERVPERILFFPTPGVVRRIRGLAEQTGADLVLLDPALPLGGSDPASAYPTGSSFTAPR